MFGRPLRIRLDPSSERKVLDNQSDQVVKRANSTRNVKFEEGDHLQVRDYRPNADKWQQSTVVVSQSGPLSYKVGMADSLAILWCRHTHQTRRSTYIEHDAVSMPGILLNQPPSPNVTLVGNTENQPPETRQHSNQVTLSWRKFNRISTNHIGSMNTIKLTA